MCAFHGAERVARIRFANYICKQKIMAKLVNQVLPTTSHILVVGDGQFQSSMKGLPSGVSNAFVKKCSETHKLIFTTEFRKSILDCDSQTGTYHPVRRGKFGISSNGRRYTPAVYGLVHSGKLWPGPSPYLA